MEDKILKVGLVQRCNLPTAAANRAAISQEAHELAALGAQLIVLSELHDGPYFCQTENVDTFELAQSLQGQAT